jgi:predicted transposase YbfD/YdcC
MDALHAQHDTARAVLDRRADYGMTIKANMPTLYAQLKKLPWKNVPGFSHVAKDHGRRTRRTAKAAPAPAWVEFDGAAQVAQVRRTVTREGKKTVEVAYVITSDADTDAATLAAWIQGHWHIENKRRWVRDVTYQEDSSLVRTIGYREDEASSMQRYADAWFDDSVVLIESGGQGCGLMSPAALSIRVRRTAFAGRRCRCRTHPGSKCGSAVPPL